MYYTSTVIIEKMKRFHCYVCLPEGKHATFCSHGIRLCKCNVNEEEEEEEEEANGLKAKEAVFNTKKG